MPIYGQRQIGTIFTIPQISTTAANATVIGFNCDGIALSGTVGGYTTILNQNTVGGTSFGYWIGYQQPTSPTAVASATGVPTPQATATQGVSGAAAFGQ
jgi:hypothetical protein